MFNMITYSQQAAINDEIARAKSNNAKATEAMHIGHNVITQRWDSMHVVKACEQCECTVSNIVKKPTNRVVTNPFTGVFSKQRDGKNYKVVR